MVSGQICGIMMSFLISVTLNLEESEDFCGLPGTLGGDDGDVGTVFTFSEIKFWVEGDEVEL